MCLNSEKSKFLLGMCYNILIRGLLIGQSSTDCNLTHRCTGKRNINPLGKKPGVLPSLSSSQSQKNFTKITLIKAQGRGEGGDLILEEG